MSSHTAAGAHGLPLKDPKSGHPGHLSTEQEHVLALFKQQLGEEGFYDPAKHDDATCLRFLRARKFDLAKAKIMWIDTQKWRQAYKVDELYETFDYTEKAQVSKLYPRFYHKTDKDGRPIYVEQLGKLDLTKLYAVTTPERQLQSLVVEYERFVRDRLPICSELQGALVETSCTIMDLKDLGVSQFWKVKNYVQEASAISQNNYPESMGKFYIINAPWGFSTVWSLVKGWLDEATVAKIHILGSNYKTELLEQIPKESLPAFLGGGCFCGEGCSMSDAGPWKGKKGGSIRKVDASGAVEGAPAAAPAPHAAVAEAPVLEKVVEAPAVVEQAAEKVEAPAVVEQAAEKVEAPAVVEQAAEKVVEAPVAVAQPVEDGEVVKAMEGVSLGAPVASNGAEHAAVVNGAHEGTVISSP